MRTMRVFKAAKRIGSSLLSVTQSTSRYYCTTTVLPDMPANMRIRNDTVPTSDSLVFPLDQLLPKNVTQASEFLTKYPQYDGRGITIAIMDTGIDPASPGLQTTTEGKPKIIDIMDCSGAGDVDTSTVRKAENGVVEGLTGRKLKIPDSWTNPSGRFHLGVKLLNDMYAPTVKARLAAERKERLWEKAQSLALANAQDTLTEHIEANGDTLKSLEERWQREELAARVDLLKAVDKNYEDLGLVADCIVFFDGDKWRACVDTTFRGQLEHCTLLGNYRDTHQYATLTDNDLTTYSVNIHKKGNLLEIVTTTSSHGTHVAGIAGAHFADRPEKNGIAPGAQLVSLKISDCRSSGSMETGTAFVRALNRCIELGVDVVNYSFGEAAHIANSGDMIEQLRRMVFRHNILFVSSAGNNGPALSTAGAPGASCDASLGVGAYLTPKMVTAMYSLPEEIPAVLYPWSSRGPSTDGALGVSIAAPGGAITCVPRWVLRPHQLMNGTSMSSPNATGTIACLMSALKAENIKYNVYSIRTALENTAELGDNDDAFAIGTGLIQLKSAYEYHTNNKEALTAFEHLIRFDIKVKGDEGNMRGIYLRNLHESDRMRHISVDITPVFRHDAPTTAKAEFNRHLVLTCSDDWVTHPAHVTMTNMPLNLTLRVDCMQLPEDSVNLCEVCAYDTDNPALGILWRIPITAIKPVSIPGVGDHKARERANSMASEPHVVVESQTTEGELMSPAHPKRHFLHVPEGAEYAVLTLRSNDIEKDTRFIVHAVQLLPDQSYRMNESHKMLTLAEGGRTEHAFRVHSGRTLELTVAKWWASLGESHLHYKLAFYGLTPIERSIAFDHHTLARPVHALSGFQYEELAPAISLRYMCVPLKPTSSTLRPLGVRDTHVDGQQTYLLSLEYTVDIQKTCELTVEPGGVGEYLYDNQTQCFFWMLFTASKQFLGAGDAFPDRYYTKVAKGEHTIRAYVRSTDEAQLQRLKDLTAIVRFKLPSSLNLDVYTSLVGALKCDDKAKFTTSIGMTRQARRAFYVTPLAEDKVPKHAAAGHYLEGMLTLCKHELGRRVAQYPVTYHIGAPIRPAKVKTTTEVQGITYQPDKSSEKALSKMQQLQERRRDVDIEWLGKLTMRADIDALYAKLQQDWPTHVPLYTAYLRALVAKGTARNAADIVSACDKIIALIDPDDVLKQQGAKTELSDKLERSKTESDARRDALIEALVCKLSVMCDALLKNAVDTPSMFRNGTAPMRVDQEQKKSKKEKSVDKSESKETSKDDDSSEIETSGQSPNITASLADIDALTVLLQRFIDASDKRAAMVLCKAACAHGQHARGLRLLQQCQEPESAMLMQLSIELYECLGWQHVAQTLRNAHLVKHPPNYRPF